MKSVLVDDPASILLDRIGMSLTTSEPNLIRRKCGFWLTVEEEQMVDDLKRITGAKKYEIVGLAIRSVYARAIQRKEERES